MANILSRLFSKRVAITLTTIMLAAAPFATATSANAAAASQATEQKVAKPVKPADVCNYTTARPTLRRGSTGPAVQQAQCYLNWSMTGDNLVEDGIFGTLTYNATVRFQRCAGIGVDGVIGPQTWSYLAYWANSPYYVC